MTVSDVISCIVDHSTDGMAPDTRTVINFSNFRHCLNFEFAEAIVDDDTGLPGGPHKHLKDSYQKKLYNTTVILDTHAQMRPRAERHGIRLLWALRPP